MKWMARHQICRSRTFGKQTMKKLFIILAMIVMCCKAEDDAFGRGGRGGGRVGGGPVAGGPVAGGPVAGGRNPAINRSPSMSRGRSDFGANRPPRTPGQRPAFGPSRDALPSRGELGNSPNLPADRRPGGGVSPRPSAPDRPGLPDRPGIPERPGIPDRPSPPTGLVAV